MPSVKKHKKDEEHGRTLAALLLNNSSETSFRLTPRHHEVSLALTRFTIDDTERIAASTDPG
jgi:hypothetical protein